MDSDEPKYLMEGGACGLLRIGQFIGRDQGSFVAFFIAKNIGLLVASFSNAHSACIFSCSRRAACVLSFSVEMALRSPLSKHNPAH